MTIALHVLALVAVGPVTAIICGGLHNCYHHAGGFEESEP